MSNFRIAFGLELDTLALVLQRMTCYGFPQRKPQGSHNNDADRFYLAVEAALDVTCRCQRIIVRDCLQEMEALTFATLTQFGFPSTQSNTTTI